MRWLRHNEPPAAAQNVAGTEEHEALWRTGSRNDRPATKYADVQLGSGGTEAAH